MKSSTLQRESTRAAAVPMESVVPQAERNAPPVPSHEDIARRAYDIYIENGCQPDQCKLNWKQAEQDLRNGAQGEGTCVGQECCCEQSPVTRRPSTVPPRGRSAKV